MEVFFDNWQRLINVNTWKRVPQSRYSFADACLSLRYVDDLVVFEQKCTKDLISNELDGSLRFLIKKLSLISSCIINGRRFNLVRRDL